MIPGLILETAVGGAEQGLGGVSGPARGGWFRGVDRAPTQEVMPFAAIKLAPVHRDWRLIATLH